MTWLIEKALALCGGRKWMVYAILAVVAAALVAMLYGGGYWRGYHAADQKALIEKQKTTISTLQTDLGNANSQLEQLEKLRRENKALVEKLSVAEGKEKIVYRTIRAAIANIPPATVKPTADGRGTVCTLPTEYVRLWNDAIAPERAGMQATASGVADTPAAAGAAATVTSTDLLNNHVDNSEIARDNFRQCDALITWHNHQEQ